MTAGFDDWIGRTERANDVVTPQLVQRFKATLDDSTASEPGTPAPPGIHWCLAPVAVAASAVGPDGHPQRGLHLPPIGLPRRMWASGQLEFHAPLIVGESVQRMSRIESIETKQGRSGELCFVRVMHEWRSGEMLAIREQQTIVYRGAGGDTPPNGERRPVPDGTMSRQFVPDEVTLFRYSALTFNGHRIHYDQPYATKVEGYSGLVVHGPLQATRLLALATELGGSPRRFAFRGLRPLIVGDVATLNAHETDSGMHLWVSNEAGEETMTARAEW